MNAANNIFNLPDDIVREILTYIPRQKLVFVNKLYYNSYHCCIKKYISLYESYVRDTLRRDNFFVFEKIVEENFKSWIENRQYRYKNMVFSNYIYFVLHFCTENNSEMCHKILIKEFKKRDLCRNLHKKNIIKYIKWNS